MIAKNDSNNQLPTEIKSVFKELNMFKHLRDAGIKKLVGFSCAYIFQFIFSFIFENKNWYRMLERKKSSDVPAKDAVYRCLNTSTYTRIGDLCCYPCPHRRLPRRPS